MKLASIEVIKSLSPIPGADRIQLATVLGWQTIVKVGEFKEGDRCVWHSPDTVVDSTNPLYDFLASKHHRIKVVKFKGKFSQGLALPLFPLLPPTDPTRPYDEGVDISSLINIKKYEREVPACLSGEVLGSFPSHLVSKTDELLLRSHPDATTELAGKRVNATLKLDGSSCTFGFVDSEFFVCSRNLMLKQTEGNSFWEMAVKLNLEAKLRAVGTNVIFQGELVGPGIQKNPMGLTEKDFFVFNVMIPNPDRVYTNSEVGEALARMHGLKWVPTVWTGTLPEEADKVIPFLQEFVNTQKYPNGVPAEGIVVRPVQERKSDALAGRLSVKIINENYSD